MINQECSKSNKLKLSLSPIHGWGVFAEKPFRTNEIVIEYVGELISSKEADVREKINRSGGMEETYLFSIGNGKVIDATCKGNVSKFINHSCDPNCYTKVYEKHNRIEIIAMKPIKVSDELTFDYNFKKEKDKILCHCKSKLCRGFLN
ncbi:CLUMA_CG002348, isoform A [Clunio marinus]|uniref:[histone H3]-lysine(4) N-trimethyltransferase n=1 Tax=Clunio marinus TaxID=568069 RepID=A0A1J1HKU2_9DIPT|nr:CLUMA_CG002348, isoform A [Clunio marinus]